MFTHGQLLLVATTFHIVEPHPTCASPELMQCLRDHTNMTDVKFHRHKEAIERARPKAGQPWHLATEY
jgi:hypothetical protein